MHIPDGFLTGEAALVGTATGTAGLAVCLRGAARSMREKDLPLAGLAAAFFLVAEAPMVPITVGTQGHLLGGALAVALLGPWVGALTIAVVCAIQALVLGDGGITTLGLTITNLALVPAFVGYPLLLALRRVMPVAFACAAVAAVSVLLAAAVFVVELELGAAVSIDRTAIAASILGSYAIIAALEAGLTFVIVRALVAVRPDLVRAARRRAVSG
jgi:cobalt/nickel transport system permease protein